MTDGTGDLGSQGRGGIASYEIQHHVGTATSDQVTDLGYRLVLGGDGVISADLGGEVERLGLFLAGA